MGSFGNTKSCFHTMQGLYSNDINSDDINPNDINSDDINLNDMNAFLYWLERSEGAYVFGSFHKTKLSLYNTLFHNTQGSFHKHIKFFAESFRNTSVFFHDT